MFKDIRDYQILFLCCFLIMGIGTRDWTLHPEFIAVAIATCVATQLLLSWVSGKGLTNNIRSAVITALGLSLLLRTDDWTTMFIAAFAGIASKFLFQIDHKHCFNPANFGIISALSLTHNAWVSPGQWGEDWWYGLLFLGTGGLILKRIGRWDTTAAFLIAYSSMEAIRNLWLGWTWDVFLHRLMSGSLILFALFMITDPRSIPDSRKGRILWSVAIASLTFILRNYFFLPTAVFWALFILAPFTVFIDRIWSSSRFTWFKAGKLELTQLHAQISAPNSVTS